MQAFRLQDYHDAAGPEAVEGGKRLRGLEKCRGAGGHCPELGKRRPGQVGGLSHR